MSYGKRSGAAQSPVRAAIVAAFLLPFVFAPSVFAQTADEVEAAAARAVRSHGIQAELPKDELDEGWKLTLPDISVTTWVLWCAILVGLIAVVYPMRDQFLFSSRGQDEDWDEGAAKKPPGPRQNFASISESADDLARQGRFMEAIHFLLLHALMEMRQRLKAQFADSLTSREILRGANLSSEASAALQDMITRVETTYFGDHPAAAGDYAACRLSFDQFARHLQAGGRR